MNSIDKALLRQLLGIERPWEVREYRLDVRKRRCDVWIGPEVERGWFGRPKSVVSGENVIWQHLALGTVRFHLHVTLPTGQDTQGLGWMGEVGQPFTRALAAQVFALFNEGVSLQSVCTLLDLSLQDVWSYRHALDTGRTGSGTAAATVRPAAAKVPVPTTTPGVALTAASTAATPAPVAPVPTAVSVNSQVPDVNDPVWLRLLNGEQHLDIKVLSLKLMLSKLRSQLDLIQDDNVRTLKLKELHRYFVKNERVLTHELNQLRLG
ncbi:MAG: hypothetical protein RLZZ352_1865 [Pseudomonadota bacterium]|jgi:hypothetical protein